MYYNNYYKHFSNNIVCYDTKVFYIQINLPIPFIGGKSIWPVTEIDIFLEDIVDNIRLESYNEI